MATPAAISISPIVKTTARIPLKGVSPLIMHKWSEKAKQIMLDTQQGKKAPKEHRNPQTDYEATIYHTENGDYGFPAIAFKAAMVRAGKLLNIKMVDARQLISISGVPSDDGVYDLAVISGEPRMREDMCRVGMGTDLRYRAEFVDWATIVNVSFYDNLIDLSSIINLLQFAGDSVGIGEWRPEKDGDKGRFIIDDSREIEVTK